MRRRHQVESAPVYRDEIVDAAWQIALSRLPSLARQDAAGRFGRSVLRSFWSVGWHNYKPRDDPRTARWIKRLVRAGILVVVHRRCQRRIPWRMPPHTNDSLYTLTTDLAMLLHEIER